MGRLPAKPRNVTYWHRITAFLIVFILASSACEPSGQVLSTPSAASTATVATNWYSIYFTQPTSPTARSYRGGPDETLAAAIGQARVTVDIAIYDLNLWSIRDALVKAYRRGVTVRVVAESDNMDEQEIQDLKDTGIQVLGDRREGLMHDKFIIIDHSEVWTGSMNLTTGGVYLDNNSLLRIRSSRLAENYTREFEQMFVDDHFGSVKFTSTLNPIVTIDGSQVEIYFSPQDGTLQHILNAISRAQESVYFLAYSFTSDELSQALIEKAMAGVRVQGVFDKDQYRSNSGTEYDNLRNAGIEAYLDANPQLMHHKVIIIDQQVVITGSYNFSNNAEYNNDENTLIIHNSDVAAQYLAEFQQIYNLAKGE
jgi:phosphatidylserine/phosphatidylglycerophosphate/cardiolipin synthase-like enzyme